MGKKMRTDEWVPIGGDTMHVEKAPNETDRWDQAVGTHPRPRTWANWAETLRIRPTSTVGYFTLFFYFSCFCFTIPNHS
jgi:hypothetical protein